MRSPFLTLFNFPCGMLVIAPQTRFPIIIEAGAGSLLHGRMIDRATNTCTMNLEDVDIVRLIVRLITYAVKRGLVSSPIGTKEVGIVQDERDGIHGCYSVRNGQPSIPLFEVSTHTGSALARTARRRFVYTKDPSGAMAAISAASAFLGSRAAA